MSSETTYNDIQVAPYARDPCIRGTQDSDVMIPPLVSPCNICKCNRICSDLEVEPHDWNVHWTDLHISDAPYIAALIFRDPWVSKRTKICAELTPGACQGDLLYQNHHHFLLACHSSSQHDLKRQYCFTFSLCCRFFHDFVTQETLCYVHRTWNLHQRPNKYWYICGIPV